MPSEGVPTINAAMPNDYGSANGQPREQLDGYFDDSAPIVHTKSSRFDPLRCTPCTRRKKICCTIFILLLIIVIIIIAVGVAAATNENVARALGLSSAKKTIKDGSGCTGNTSVQNQCLTGECIYSKFLCDGFSDCPDGGDEEEYACGLATDGWTPCKDEDFRCPFSGKCVSKEKRCDGKPDCPERFGGDEDGCFAIDKDSKAYAIQRGKLYQLLYKDVTGEFADYMCSEMGFGPMVAVKPFIQHPSPKQCAVFNPGEETERIDDPLGFDYDNGYAENPDDDDASDDDFPNENPEVDEPPIESPKPLPTSAIQLSTQCSESVLKLGCFENLCGTFSSYQGPKALEESEELKKDEDEIYQIAFPWVVNIQKEGVTKCKGTIINNEWVITTSSCIDQHIFRSSGKERTWLVQTAAAVERKQESRIIKVMRNHFGRLDADPTDDLIVLQVDPPFVFRGFVRPICLERGTAPKYCFAAGSLKDDKDGESVHARIVVGVKNTCNETSTLGLKSSVTPDTLCYQFPHPGDKDVCMRSKGSPISCLDPVYNKWSMFGVLKEDLGCGANEQHAQLAIDMAEEFNYNWALVVTSPGRVYDICGPQSPIQGVRFMAGSRQGEVYVDIRGRSINDGWYTLYGLSNTSPAIKLLIPAARGQQRQPFVKVGTDSEVTSLNVAELNCPADAQNLCACKVSFSGYSPVKGHASTLLFYEQEDVTESGDVNDDYWDDENNLDSLYPEPPKQTETVEPWELLSRNLTGCQGDNNTIGRCGNSSVCISLQLICDGVPDCPYRDDENPELCPRIFQQSCTGNSFRCLSDYKCIPLSLMCDGRPDCRDGSDERGCFKEVYDGNIVATKQGVTYVLSADNIVPDLADDICYSLGYRHSVSFKRVNYTSSSRTPLYSQICHEISYPKSTTPESLPFYLVPSKCLTILQLQCRHCGTKEPVSNKTEYLKNPNRLPLPWEAQVFDGDKQICAGTVVSYDYVMAPRTCVPKLKEGIKIKYTTSKDGVMLKQHTVDVTMLVHFELFRRPEPKIGVEDFNVVLLRVFPAMAFNASFHPICLEPRSLFAYPGCYVSVPGEDDTEVQQRLITVSPERCMNNSITVGPNQACMAYEHPEKPDSCVRSKGKTVQCVDEIRGRITLGGLIKHDIGNCDGNRRDFMAVDDLSIETDWLTAISEFDQSLINEKGQCGNWGTGKADMKWRYDRANAEDEWFVVVYKVTPNEGKLYAAKWSNEHALNLLTKDIMELAQARATVAVSQKSNVTTLHTVVVTCGANATDLCACEFKPENGLTPVSSFYLVSPDDEFEEKLGDELGFFDEEDPTILAKDDPDNLDEIPPTTTPAP